LLDQGCFLTKLTSGCARIRLRRCRLRRVAHFDDDIARAWKLHAVAIATDPIDSPLAADVSRVALAFGVGALDANLCDAFSDTLARCLKSCRNNGHPRPAGYRKLALPIGR
jgi:hypothetical protein